MNTLADLRRWAASAPVGTTIPATSLVELLDGIEEEPGAEHGPRPVDNAPDSWRSKLWTVAPQTRMHVPDVAEALGKSRHAVYRFADSKKSEAVGRKPLPCRRLAGELVFEAGAVRQWIERNEETVNGGPRLRVEQGRGSEHELSRGRPPSR